MKTLEGDMTPPKPDTDRRLREIEQRCQSFELIRSSLHYRDDVPIVL